MTERLSAPPLALDLQVGDAHLESALAEASRRAVTDRWADRGIGRRDPGVWSSDPAVQAAISERLGWLEAPFHFADEVEALGAFAAGIRDAGFDVAVLAGMGGSSLAPAMLAHVFGAPDGIPVRVLDSTDPATVAAALDDLDPLSTLFIVSTKSGTTAESISFEAYQWDRVADALRAAGRHGREPGEYMIAITDPDKSLRSIPHHDQLREVFLNTPDVGGRYSALTYVGLVPGALLGIDIGELLERGRNMAVTSSRAEPADNPGLSLGLAIGTFAANGRDKLTFVIDREIASFGSWVEQLIAESTGKHGVGIVPIDGEALGPIDVYGPDRVFVRIALEGSIGPAGSDAGAADARLAELAAAGHPVIRLSVAERLDLGAECVRWEVATAIAGAVLGIDPFDQPNVEEAKENTRKVLAAIEGEGGAGAAGQPTDEPIAQSDGLRVFGDAPLRLSQDGGRSVAGELRRHLGRLKPNGYVSIQAYIAPAEARDEALERIRLLLRDRTHRATTVGYGPRFLHSTGQLHKGGAPIGWFLQLTADHPVDRPIPGRPYSFGQLIDAQAAGDLQTLESHDLPVLRVHLGPDPDAGLLALERALEAALGES